MLTQIRCDLNWPGRRRRRSTDVQMSTDNDELPTFMIRSHETIEIDRPTDRSHACHHPSIAQASSASASASATGQHSYVWQQDDNLNGGLLITTRCHQKQINSIGLVRYVWRSRPTWKQTDSPKQATVTDRAVAVAVAVNALAALERLCWVTVLDATCDTA